jgi:hypothetical protein
VGLPYGLPGKREVKKGLGIDGCVKLGKVFVKIGLGTPFGAGLASPEFKGCSFSFIVAS